MVYRLIHTVEQIDIPGFVVDVVEDGFRYQMINRAHERASGMLAADIAGKTPFEILPERLARTVEENYRRCLQSAKSYTYEEYLQLPLGPAWWQTTLTPIEENGEICRLLGFAIDITDRKYRDFELAENVHQIKQLNDQLESLASAAAHDLRGPLRQIKLVMEMLNDGFQDLGDGKKDLLGTASQIVEKALGQIDDILSYQRSLTLETTEPAICDLRRVCSDFVSTLDPFNEKHVEYPSVSVRTDVAALQIVLRNLFDNALKHCKSRVELSLRTPDDGDWLTFLMADDGPGFDSEHYPIGESPEPGLGGVTGGFGLAAVRKIVEARGGVVTIEEPRFENGGAISVTFAGHVVADTADI